jgi:hypothetical protein
MEADAGAAIAAMGDQPVALVLADVCAALGLEGQDARDVLGAETAAHVEHWLSVPVLELKGARG